MLEPKWGSAPGPATMLVIRIKVVDEAGPTRNHQRLKLNVAFRSSLERIQGIAKAFSVIEHEGKLLEECGAITFSWPVGKVLKR